MKVRHKDTGKIGESSKYNTTSTSEIIVFFEDDSDSDFVWNYDVELGLGDGVYWKDLLQAFEDGDLITDNGFTRFFEPENDEDRTRGYTLD